MGATCDLPGRLACFRDLDAPAFQHIAARLPERRFTRGTLLFHEGEPCPGFWLVKQGAVHIQRISAAGKVQILETCGAGDVFALACAVDGGTYPATAEVRDDAVLLFFPREDLLAIMGTAPAVAIAVARKCAARLRHVTELAASLGLHDVRERVAGFLADEAETRGVCGRDGQVEVDLEGPQHEIAQRLGMAREVYARMLKTLERDGLIEHFREHVRIRDLARLRRTAD